MIKEIRESGNANLPIDEYSRTNELFTLMVQEKDYPKELIDETKFKFTVKMNEHESEHEDEHESEHESEGEWDSDDDEEFDLDKVNETKMSKDKDNVSKTIESVLDFKIVKVEEIQKVDVIELEETPKVNVIELEETPKVNVVELEETPKIEINDMSEDELEETRRVEIGKRLVIGSEVDLDEGRYGDKYVNYLNIVCKILDDYKCVDSFGCKHMVMKPSVLRYHKIKMRSLGLRRYLRRNSLGKRY